MIAAWSKRLAARLRSKDYREAYVAENVRTGIAYQIRALRSQRGWAQKKLAEELGKPQSVVSRLEDPDYGKVSVQTLLEVAKTFDVALLIQYVSFPDFLSRTRDVSPMSMQVPSYDERRLTFPVSDAISISDGYRSRMEQVSSSSGKVGELSTVSTVQ